MQLYQKVLFIGARGEYLDMPFEILGSGQVGYTVNKVGDPNNSDDIGSTFPAVEYYCLANNGQTWYFAVSDNEVYYCRQLNEDEIYGLKEQMAAPDFSVENFLNGDYKTELVEYGLGKLNQAEGRAKRDFREFSEFTYLDFKVDQKSYSIDIFPDDYQEWFETIWIPNNQLSTIFKESLGLENPAVKEIFKAAKMWLNIAIISFILASIIPAIAIILALQTKQVYDQKKSISTADSSEVIFEDIKILEINKTYKLETQTELEKDQGISLNFTLLNEKGELVSSSNQEYFNTSTDNNQNVSTEFFPDKPETYKLLIKVNDYGNVGYVEQSSSATSSVSNSSSLNNTSSVPPRVDNLTPTNLKKVNITVKVFKDTVNFFNWIIAGVFVALIGVGCLVYKYILEGKTWKDFTLKKKP